MSSVGHYTAVELLKQACPIGRVIDVGAFPGTLTRMLAANGYDVTALDKEPDRGIGIQQRFQFGTELHGQEQTFSEAMRVIGVDTRAADVEYSAFPLEDASADAVVLTEVIEHLFVNPLLALTEINRVLKPGGVLLLSTPNLLSLRNRVNFLRGNMEAVIQTPFTAHLQKVKIGHCGHVRTYAPSELRDMLGRIGFDCEFHFRSFEYWDPAPSAAANEARFTQAPRPSVLRKFVRSPASYARAGIATTRAALERMVPEFRPHMFVIARKREAVTMADLQAMKVAVQN